MLQQKSAFFKRKGRFFVKLQEVSCLIRYIPERMVDEAMLKRVICLVLLLCCLACTALADYRYVWNGTQWDARLNLRAEPSKSSVSLGRYYTGVRVQVLEDLGEWSRVRIAMGTSDEYVEGYMMNGYLSREYIGTGMLPYGVYNGRRAYVMAYNSNNLHLMYEDGSMGYFYTKNATVVKPQEAEQLLIERICTAENGATLRSSTGTVVATLYGGVTMDGMIFAGRTRALAMLNDENDEVIGVIDQSGWTWMDNGANCEEKYAVYESENGLIEVLGRMADGRTILRIMDNSIDAPRVVLTSGFHLTDLTPLQREGSYYKYTYPLTNEPKDHELISQVYACLNQEKLAALAGCTVQVERLVDFQYGHHILRVKFVDVYGHVRGIADIDDNMMIWQDEDNG